MSSSLTTLSPKVLAARATTTVAPKTPTTVPPAAPTPPPGQWTHPKLDEIARRQAASTFSTRNLQNALYGVVFLLATFIVPGILTSLMPIAVSNDIAYYTWLSLQALRAIGLAQIIHSLFPLLRKPDEITDIPLTPRQRTLLNLTPSSKPATPEIKYITPPRYTRSTPRTGSSASDRRVSSVGSSRAATVGSPISRSVGGSPLGGPSPLVGSGTGSVLGMSGNGSPFGPASPGSGSPLARKAAERRSSVGLTNKWLYQRRKDSPGGYYS